jgi:glycosyltransferase involved in cell wall biosynthesis
VVTVIPGVHAAAMRMLPGVTRDAVVTVNFSTDPVRYVQKGVAAFVAAARALPGLRFRLLTRFPNPADRGLLDPVPPNLEIVTRFLTEAELCEFLNTARVYVQLSLHEGFGVAVAEGMLCGAVPVIARGIASEEIAGPCGFRVPFGDVAGAVAAIRQAWDLPPDAWDTAREQALSVVNEERRNAQLLALIGDLMPAQG